MRFLFRVFAVWFLGLTFVLLIIDGTKSLAANELMMTSLLQIWEIVHVPSLEETEAAVLGSAWELVWSFAASTVLIWPAWAVTGTLGLVLALAGQTRKRRSLGLDEF